jgi:nucleoside-diphosphate-sugar epimerase
MVALDRDASERAGTFGTEVAALEPDVVVDLICYSEESAAMLVGALRGRIAHLLHCGTIFVNGHAVAAPIRESDPRNPFGDYGVKKAAAEAFLLAQAKEDGVPVTVLHPGHVVGEGWWPLNPAANFNPDVFATLAQGRELALPHFGLETIHHVHGADVAQGFALAIDRGTAVSGMSYYVVSDAALTLRGFAEEIARWFGAEPVLRFLPWDDWAASVTEADRSATWEHVSRSPNHSIARARADLGYEPVYSSLAAVQEALQWMMDTQVFPQSGPARPAPGLKS